MRQFSLKREFNSTALNPQITTIFAALNSKTRAESTIYGSKQDQKHRDYRAR